MDTLSEESIDHPEECVKVNDDLSIGCLEFVDDVLTSTNGIKCKTSVKLASTAVKDNWGRSG